MVQVGSPFRRCTSRRDERRAQGPARASKRVRPAVFEGPHGDGPLRRAGFRVVGLSRRRATSSPCVNGDERVVVPRVRAAWTCVRVARRVLAYPNRRRVSQPPGLYKPSAFPRVLKDLLSVDTPAGVHSRGLSPASARRLPAPRSFRPRRSSRPRRFPPPTGSRACCVPHPTLRFTGFPRTDDACLRPPPRFPTSACPPELFPSEERSPRHREALPPCRSPATPARLRGLVPLGNPWQRRLVAEPHCSMLSWASPLGAPADHAPSGTPQKGSERCATNLRSAGRSAGSIRASCATAAQRPRPRRVRGGGTSGRRHRRAALPIEPTVCAAAEAASSPVCPRPGDVAQGVEPAAPREPIGHPPARLARGRAHRSSFRGVDGSLTPRGYGRRSDRPRLLARVP